MAPTTTTLPAHVPFRGEANAIQTQPSKPTTTIKFNTRQSLIVRSGGPPSPSRPVISRLSIPVYSSMEHEDLDRVPQSSADSEGQVPFVVVTDASPPTPSPASSYDDTDHGSEADRDVSAGLAVDAASITAIRALSIFDEEVDERPTNWIDRRIRQHFPEFDEVRDPVPQKALPAIPRPAERDWNVRTTLPPYLAKYICPFVYKHRQDKMGAIWRALAMEEEDSDVQLSFDSEPETESYAGPERIRALTPAPRPKPVVPMILK